MKRSEHLHQLIKSLSKSEKRSFKLFANRHTIGEKNNYIQLFDAIDKQEQYDEAILIKKLKDEKLTNNLSSVKVQLYNLILKNLRQYNPTNKTTYELRMQMDYIDILFEKGLYNQCKKVLKKAQETARKYEKYIIIDALSIYEYEIAIKESNFDDIQNYINVTFPEVKKIRNTNEILAEYEYLLASIKLLALKSNRTGLTIDKSKFEKLVQHELLKADVNSQPYRCQIDHHTIWGYYYNIMGSEEKTYFHRKKVLDLIEENPNEMSEYPKEWIFHARNLLGGLGRFKMFEEFDIEQHRIRGIIDKISETKKTQNLNAEIYNTIYNVKLDMDIDRGLFKQSSTYAKEAQVHFKTYENQIDLNSQMVIYFNFSYAYLGNGEYQKALLWVNKLINNNYGNVRMDAQCMSRIMNIVIHYELGNYEIISSLIRSTNRFLIKVDRKFEFETSFLKFANKHFQNKYYPEQQSSFQNEIDNLTKIAEDPFEKKGIEFFDVISWLKTKTENKTMEEIISGKVTKERFHRGVM
jgi:hypothetical protein